ncbi:BTAD domain-containing putative transcriptional regulator [Paractinoplanes bogorensis]|uniref:BTAD domain-containing putative transcriptional regulator n=1 Tax=Paractinoplanes bogorensis TaxID=1610840 RepID=UPI0027DFF641|nr:BTAD domain-containing putative transcriptional regulator [Actinoplanes bogorensis]
MTVGFGVLGPVTAWDAEGEPIALKGPRHRAVLARLIVARGRVVPVGHLVDDLWLVPPEGAVSAVRTFVAALRRAIEPDRAPRTPPSVLVTEGPGYALRTTNVDAWRFEQLMTENAQEALNLWRGPAYAEFADEPWARAERARLSELRLRAVELLATERIDRGRHAEAIADLDAHVTGHPWREDAWRLLALALYRDDRPGDALAVLCRARERLVSQLGLDPGPALSQLETDILRRATHLTPASHRPVDDSPEAADRTTASQPARPAHVTTNSAWAEHVTTISARPEHVTTNSARPEHVTTNSARPEHVTTNSARHGQTSNRSTPGDAENASSPPSGESVSASGAAENASSPPSGESVRASAAPDNASSPPSGESVRASAAPDNASSPPSGENVRASAAAENASSPPSGESVWASAAADYDRIVAAGARARLDSTVGLLRSLAVTGGGGLQAARRHRTAAIAAAEELGDPELTARVIGAYNVPAIWTRVDDPEQAAQVVAAAERTLPGQSGAARGRLLTTIALETRGDRDAYGRKCALEAVGIARRMDDPGLLAFALNGQFMQSFYRCGLAPERDAIGAELVVLAQRHGLITYEVLGRLIRMQARSALADPIGADEHATAVDHLAEQHELPLVAVFTGWHRAMRNPSATAYRSAAAGLQGAGMPGLEHGLLPLALLCLEESSGEQDFGPYEPWARPHLLLAEGDRAAAREALRAVPEPPPDLLSEALWVLIARAAQNLDESAMLERARAALRPAAGQIAGAGSGVLTAGPVDVWL